MYGQLRYVSNYLLHAKFVLTVLYWFLVEDFDIEHHIFYYQENLIFFLFRMGNR